MVTWLLTRATATANLPMLLISALVGMTRRALQT